MYPPVGALLLTRGLQQANQRGELGAAPQVVHDGGVAGIGPGASGWREGGVGDGVTDAGALCSSRPETGGQAQGGTVQAEGQAAW